MAEPEPVPAVFQSPPATDIASQIGQVQAAQVRAQAGSNKKVGLRPWEFANEKVKVKGIVRRKGEKDPRKYGLWLDGSIPGHEKLTASYPLPPRDAAGYKAWKEIVDRDEKERNEAKKALTAAEKLKKAEERAAAKAALAVAAGGAEKKKKKACFLM